MMNKALQATLFAISCIACSSVFAGPPECVPGQGGDKVRPEKPEKVAILHCGCSDSGDVMQYVEILVSSKSKGHKKHIAGSIDSCSDGGDSYTDFVRNGSDCQLDGPAMDDLEFCSDDKAAGQECGSAVID